MPITGDELLRGLQPATPGPKGVTADDLLRGAGASSQMDEVANQALATRAQKTTPGVMGRIGEGVSAFAQGLLGATPEEIGQPATEPGMTSTLGEMAGGTAGEVLGPLGSGAGTVLGGTLGDIESGAPLSLGRTATRMATGTLIPPAVGAVTEGIGKVAGAATRAVVEKLPSFAEFAERVAPGVLGRGEKALKATGDLGKIGADVVQKRFEAWSDMVWNRVRDLAGPAQVVETDAIKDAAKGLKNVPGFSLEERKAFAEVMTKPAVSFDTVHLVQSGFKRLARKSMGGQSAGDAITHQWGTLADSATQDIETFLARPDAPEGLGEAFNDAKATYAEGKRAMRATYLYRQSITPDGHFNAKMFATKVKNLADKNLLDRVADPGQAEELKQLAAEFGKQTAPSRSVVSPLTRKVASGVGLGAGLFGGEELYRRGQITPGRLATGALTLGMLHPAGRVLLSSLAGQGLAQGARQELAPASDFINWLGKQGFTP